MKLRNGGQVAFAPYHNMKTIVKRILLLSASASLLSGCCTTQVAVANWEYQIVDAKLFVPLMNAINERARDGWELMEVHPPLEPGNPTGFAVMRRPKK